MNLRFITSSILLSLSLNVSAEQNPLSALDIEKIASQVAASDAFRTDVRQIYGSLTGQSQSSAKVLIAAMSGPEKMKISSTPIDAVVAKHLGVALLPLVQDAEAKLVVQTHAEAGELDKLLLACSAATKPATQVEPVVGKATAAQKRMIEKTIVGRMMRPKGGTALHHFSKDGSLYRLEADDHSKATVHKWQILKDGTIAARIFGFNHFWRIAPDESILYVSQGVYRDEQPVFDKPVPWEIDPEAELPKKLAIINP